MKYKIFYLADQSTFNHHIRHCSLVESALEMEQVASSSPGSVRYISHAHRAHDYSGPFGVIWVHMAWYKNFV